MNPHSDAEAMELKIEEEALDFFAIQCHIRRMKRDLKHKQRTAEVYDKIGDPYRAGLLREATPGRVERIKKAEMLLEEIRKRQDADLKN